MIQLNLRPPCVPSKPAPWDKVLEHFDLSVHALGIDSSYNVITCPWTTQTCEDIIQLRPNDQRSAERFAKLQVRYAQDRVDSYDKN